MVRNVLSRSITLLSAMLLGLGAVAGTSSDGMFAYYPFNGNANDESGNGHTTTVTGASLTTDRFGNPNSAYYFDGNRSYIATNDTFRLTGATPRTISVWVKYEHNNVSGSPEACQIVSWGANASNYQRSSICIKSNQSDIYCFWGHNYDLRSTGAVPQSEWHNITYTYDGVTSKIYFDGVQDANTLTDIALETQPSKLFIGYIADFSKGILDENGGWNTSFKGAIDDVCIYDRVISETEIQNLYHAAAPGNALSLADKSNVLIPTSGVAFAGSDEKTIAAWIKPTSSMFSIFCQTYSLAKTLQIDFGVADGVLRLSYDDFNNAGWKHCTSKLSPVMNQWNYVAFTDRNGIVTLYLNGVASESFTVGAQALATLSSGTLNIGYGMINGYGTKQIDEVSIWHRALTTVELDSLMYYQTIHDTSRLVAHYTFDQQPSSMIADLSGKGHAATLQNIDNSAWVESYALMIPRLKAASSIGASSFTIGWDAPLFGIVDKYLIDVATDSLFANTVANYELLGNQPPLSVAVTKLQPTTKYFYRVKAYKASVGLVGGYSVIGAVVTKDQPLSGNALDLGKGNDFITVSKSLDMTNLSGFTVETWFKTASIDSLEQTLIALNNESNTGYQYVAIELNNKQLRFLYREGSGDSGGENIYYPLNKSIENVWHHVAVVFSSSPNKMYLYLDGELAGSLASSQNCINASTQMVVGQIYSGGSRNFYGSLDELRVWKVARNQAQIKSALHDTVSVSDASLLAYYRFNQNLGTTLKDVSGNGYNGTIQNITDANWVNSKALIQPVIKSFSNVLPSGFTVQYSGYKNSKYSIEVSENDAFTQNKQTFESQDTVANIAYKTTKDTLYVRLTAQVDQVNSEPALSKLAVPLNDMVAYYPFNGTALDASAYQNDGNAVHVQYATDRFGKANSCGSFLQADDYVSVINNATIDLQKSKTIACWINTSSLNAYSTFIGKVADNDFFPTYCLQVDPNNGNKYTFMFGNDGTNYKITSSQSATDFLNTWVYVVGTYSYESGDMKLYFNGELSGTNNVGQLPSSSVTDSLFIGKYRNTYTESELYNGYLDDIRLYNRELSASEVLALYHEGGWLKPAAVNKLTAIAGDKTVSLTWDKSADANFWAYRVYCDSVAGKRTLYKQLENRDSNKLVITGLKNGTTYTIKIVAVDSTLLVSDTTQTTATPVGLVAYYPFNANATDISGNQNNGTITGGVTPTLDRFGNANAAYQFDGLTGYISTAISPSLTFTDQLTVSCWVKSATQHGAFVVEHNGDFDGNFSYGFVTDGSLQFGLSANQLKYSTVKYNDDTWHHVTGVYDNIAKICVLYVDGKQVAQQSTTASLPKKNIQLTIADESNHRFKLKGMLDDIRVYNTALNATEVQSLYTEKDWRGVYLFNLSKKIAQADSLANNAPQGTSNGLYLPKTVDSLRTQISLAQFVSASTTTTQVAIDSTTNVLGTVIDWFIASRLSAPVFHPIAEQVAQKDSSFAPVYLGEYISDNNTSHAKMKIRIAANPYLSTSFDEGGALLVTQTDKSWTGTTAVYITVTDADGLSVTDSVLYTQPYLITPARQAPKGSFYANKLLIKMGDSVHFNCTLVDADTVKWNFSGGVVSSGVYLSPWVKFDTAGAYTVTLTIKNTAGEIVLSKKNYIIASALSVSDTLICPGDSVRVSVLGSGYTSYQWNTVPPQTGNSIVLKPTTTTTYRVAMKKGVATVYDSVIVRMASPANLGADTTLCSGASINFAPSQQFEQYFWNNASMSGTASYQSKTVERITLKAIDKHGCISYDTVSVTTINPLPTVSLGKDSTFCWKQMQVIDAANVGAQYRWNTSATSQTISTDTTGIFSVTVTDAHGCKASDTIALTAIVPAVPQIGVITQSSRNWNLIAWDRQAGMDSYIVWRKTIGNTFVSIDTVSKAEYNVSIDSASNPLYESFSYALTAIDSACHLQSNRGVTHNSMFMTAILTKTNEVIVRWTPDLADRASMYYIYRASKGKTLELYDSLDTKNSTETPLTYVDLDPIGLNSYYRIEYNLGHEVKPSPFKSDSGPFSQSLSNMSEVSLVSANEERAELIDIYPNPGRSLVTIACAGAIDGPISLLAANGEVVLQATLNQGKAQFLVDNLAKGLYLVQLQTNNGTIIKKLEIQ